MYDASSVEYYRGREQAERELADKAASIAIRNIHLDLADRYRELAQAAELRRTGQDLNRQSSDDSSALDGEPARA